jgi:hypothetical protein
MRVVSTAVSRNVRGRDEVGIRQLQGAGERFGREPTAKREGGGRGRSARILAGIPWKGKAHGSFRHRAG